MGKIILKKPSVILRIIGSVVILALGVAGMQVLASFKKAPVQVTRPENPLRVETKKVEAVTVPVVITGHGEVRALNSVMIAPEVSGRLERVHGNAEPGGIIVLGETLFVLDRRNYIAAKEEAVATVRQMEQGIARLQKQSDTDLERLKKMSRSRQLAKEEFERLKALLEIDQVGTKSGVDAKEQVFNSVADQEDKLSQALALYPLQIAETKSALEAAKARLSFAQTNLNRCTVKAPFTGRVKEVNVEVGQYVAAGQNLITLADDSVLEIQVSIDSRDARRWLSFTGEQSQPDIAWFETLEPVVCDIYWTEDNRASWQGQLHRVVRFDSLTRMVTLAIRIDAAAIHAGLSGGLPLVEGMFCEVVIPGHLLRDVYSLPRWAVSFENNVYLAINNRLKTSPVHVVRSQKGETFIDEGLKDGDQVIITRLVNPLENALLTLLDGDGDSEK